MHEGRSAELQSPYLRVVVVGPSPAPRGAVGRHTGALARAMSDAGHEVTLLTLSGLGRRHADGWWRAGQRRLRTADAVVLVHAGRRSLTASRAFLRGMDLVAGRPRVVLVADTAPVVAHTASEHLTASLVRRCDAVLAHDDGRARQARALGASRVSVSTRPTSAPSVPGRVGGFLDDADDGPVLTAEWARYVGTIESLVATWPGLLERQDALSTDDMVPHQRESSALDLPVPVGRRFDAPRRIAELVASQSFSVGSEAAAHVRGMVRRTVRRVGPPRPVATGSPQVVPFSRRDVPDSPATDVLVDPEDTQDALRTGRWLGLPVVDDEVGAWVALGTLAAIVALVDDDRRSCVVVDESGESVTSGESPFVLWARAVGFAPVRLGLPLDTGLDTGHDTGHDIGPDLELGSLDVLVRAPSDGCPPDEVDAGIGQAAWALRRGGLLVVTVPLGIAGVAGAVTVSELRALVARADDHGLALVGDLDGEPTALLRATEVRATAAGADDAAYGLARLTFRRT